MMLLPTKTTTVNLIISTLPHIRSRYAPSSGIEMIEMQNCSHNQSALTSIRSLVAHSPQSEKSRKTTM